MKKLILILALLPLVGISQTENSVCDASSKLTEEGANFADIKQWVEAIKRYTLAIQFCPENALAYHNRAISKQNMKDYRSACADYIEALKLNSNGNETNSDSYYGLGMCLYALGEKSKGCAAFSKSGELGKAISYEIIKKYCN